MPSFNILSSAIQRDRVRWLELLREWPGPPFSCYPSYLELFAEPGEIPLLLTRSTSQGQMMLPVVLRAIPGESEYIDAVVPYGYGSAYWHGDPAIRERFWNDVRTWAADLHVVSLVVRLPPLRSERTDWPFARNPVMKNIVRKILPWDAMWMDFEHKVRKNYKRAVGAGLAFRISGGLSALPEFLPVYVKTMHRNNAASRFLLTEGQLLSLGQELGDTCLVGIASLANDVVAAELCLVDSSTLYSFLGGTRADHFDARPNDFLKCEIMKWAADHGITDYVLGGGLGEEDGIFRYKRSFAPHGVVIFEVGEWIIDPFNYSRILTQRAVEATGWIPKPDFYPAYRA